MANPRTKVAKIEPFGRSKLIGTSAPMTTIASNSLSIKPIPASCGAVLLSPAISRVMMSCMPKSVAGARTTPTARP